MNPLIVRVDNLLSTVGNHFQKLILVRGCTKRSMSVSARRGVGFTFRDLLPTLLDDQLVEPELLSRTLQHTLLDTALGDEPEDEYLLGLANAVCTVHCLEVSLWIPVHLSGPKPAGNLCPHQSLS